MSGTTRPTPSAPTPSTSTWPGCGPSWPAGECGSRPSGASATGSNRPEASMKARMRPGPAVKVAAAATALIAVVYVAAVIVLNLLVGAHLTGQSDARLADRLSD